MSFDMDLQPRGDGRMHFSLGPVEKWLVGAVAAAVVVAAGWMVNSVQTLVTQQAVMNSKLTDLGAQLSGVPDLTNQVVELKVRVDKHDDEIKDLRAVRNLK